MSEAPDTASIRLSIHAPLPPNHPFYEKIGHVASEWAHFEHSLDLIIWDLSGIDEQKGACITASIMGHGGRCKAISALCITLKLSKSVIKRVSQMENSGFSVANHRARIVHDPWYFETGSGQVAQFRSMPAADPIYGLKDIDDAEFAETLRRIQGLRNTAENIRRDIQTEMEALRRD